MFIYMGTIDIDHLRATTSSEHLGEELGDSDNAPPSSYVQA